MAEQAKPATAKPSSPGKASTGVRKPETKKLGNGTTVRSF